MKELSINKCEWCWGEADLPKMYIPESPVLEWMEQKLIYIDRHFGMDNKLTSDEELEILFYDDMVKSVRRGHVCSKCWLEDQRLYDKYYEDDPDSRGSSK